MVTTKRLIINLCLTVCLIPLSLLAGAIIFVREVVRVWGEEA